MEVLSRAPEYRSESRHPLRDTLLLATVFLLVFTPFQALQNLQSSLNQQEGLGVASLATIYGSSFLVSFFTPAIVFNVGVKTAIVCAWVGHCLYLAANYYPSWWTLIPGSLMLGLITCPLWTSVGTYLAALAAVQVEKDLQKTPKKVTTVHAAYSHLNGIFHAIFTASQLTGNLLSSTILFQSSYNHTAPETSPRTSPMRSPPMTSSVTECGPEYCPLSGSGEHIAPPQPFIVHIMLGIFLLLDVSGLLITWRCLHTLQQPRYKGRDILRKLASYWTAFKQPKMWLLVPFFASRGMIFSLHIGLFTEAYVGCALGVRMVGYIMSVWGLTTMLSSGLLGYTARFTGRRLLFALAFVMDAMILVAMLIWRPHGGSLLVFITLVALMGLIDGIWAVQGNALIATLFPSIVDSAFSASSTWHTLSTSASFLLAKYLCPALRLYLALGLSGLAVLGYAAVEVLHWRSLHAFHYSPLQNREEEEEMTVTTSRSHKLAD